MASKLVFVFALVAAASAGPSAVDVVHDMYRSCLQDFSVSCVKPKALGWLNYVSNEPVIKITEDLLVVKKDAAPQDTEVNIKNTIVLICARIC